MLWQRGDWSERSKDDVRDLFCITHILVASIPSLHEVHKLHWLLSCKTVMLYCTVDLLLWKFISVSILTGHVQQHCWHYMVGKFVCASFRQLSISPQKSFEMIFMCIYTVILRAMHHELPHLLLFWSHDQLKQHLLAQGNRRSYSPVSVAYLTLDHPNTSRDWKYFHIVLFQSGILK